MEGGRPVAPDVVEASAQGDLIDRALTAGAQRETYTTPQPHATAPQTTIQPDLLNDERNRFVRVTFSIDSRESERATS